MDNTDLIKTVRSLDQNGPGKNGENLQVLWTFLAASSDHKFHAAEESSLRWILKSITGSSEAAETLRRFPLTWTILDCVFRRIPLFSLAKSLADRKFVAVLQQTLKDLAETIQSTDTSTSSKRKRWANASFSLDALRTQQGSFETSHVLFKSCKTLLDRLDSVGEAFSRDKLGAEHIKSLFCSSAAEAARIVAPALQLCEAILSTDFYNNAGGCQDWIKTTSALWNLHLQSSDDATIVATYFFQPASMILAKLGAFKSSTQIQVAEPLKETWLPDIQEFMHCNLALPGRVAFVNHGDLGAFTTALELSRGPRHLAVGAPALYFVASNAAKFGTETGMRKANVEWIKQTFREIELAIRKRPDRHSLLESLLDLALETSSWISLDNLRQLCKEYAFQEDETKWSLIAKIVRCDADVFQLSDDGIELRNQVCERITSQGNNHEERESVIEVIKGIQDGFRTRRDLPSFLRLWYGQLCKVEGAGQQGQSPWFTAPRDASDEKSLIRVLESELSPQVLSEVIGWVHEAASSSTPEATVVFASTIARALHSEQYTDVLGQPLFDLVKGLKGYSSFSSLRWRVVSIAMSWAAQSQRSEIWVAVKKRLGKILGKSPVLSAEAYEAFRCCFLIWDILFPDDPRVEEAAELVQAFNERLAREPASARVLEGNKLSLVEQLGIEAEFAEEYGYQQYLHWILKGSSRLARLCFAKTGKLPPVLVNAIAAKESSSNGMATLWHALLGNDVNLNELKLSKALIDRLIASFGESDDGNNWPGEEGQMWIKILSSIPLDAYERAHREDIMIILVERQSLMFRSVANITMDGWKLVLGLISKMMKRPTFYKGLRFNHLVEFSEALSKSVLHLQGSAETLIEMNERFSHMASAVLGQMADHVGQRSVEYFREASMFVSECGKSGANEESNTIVLPAFHIVLLKTLAFELTRSTNARSNEDLAGLLGETERTLSVCVAKVVDSCVTDKAKLGSRDAAMDMRIFAATDAAPACSNVSALTNVKSSSIRSFEKHARQAMRHGDLRAWKIQIHLRKHLPDGVGAPPPTTFDDLKQLPRNLRQPLLDELVNSVADKMDVPAKLAYLRELVCQFASGYVTDGQLLAIDNIVNQIIASSEFSLHADDGFDLAAVHSDLTSSLVKQTVHANIVCRILETLLEKRPQSMSQWNVELTLSTVSHLASMDSPTGNAVRYAWLCRLVEVVIKKHRLRLEGHFHLVLSTMQSLLRSLIITQDEPEPSSAKEPAPQEDANAHLFARLVTLICEPTAGAVSRSQPRGTLDSATDAAKRSAGRHMYLVLAHYVKLQLEERVPLEVRAALEPAMNSIFDITPPEGRKILNDAMDASGRAILREMFKSYVRFGKWSGV